MKRKRGSGKRKPNKPSVKGTAEALIDPGYYSDVNEENGGYNSEMEIEARKVINSTSGQHVGLDKPVVNNDTVGSAAVKLARVVSSSHTNPMSAGVLSRGERAVAKEPKSSFRDPLYKKDELVAALSVISKIMKMDAAIPFNVPVDPIELGIPDYFDIIDTPMDFGTICGRLESGLKYMNSGDVLKDVQYIWDNCCKYNGQGSYILELMKRVKNNFTKLWTAAGLFKEQQNVSNAMSHREAVHEHPMDSTISCSAYFYQHDQTLLKQRQEQQITPCFCHSFKPQPPSYHCRSLLHSGQSQPFKQQNDLSPQHEHYPHLRPLDLLNGISCNQLVNDSSPSLVRSWQPSPGCSLLGHALQKTCLHQSTSSHMPPSRLQTGMNSQSAGQIAGEGNRQQKYQMDSVHSQAYNPLASCVPAHQVNHSTYQDLQSSCMEACRNTELAGNLRMPPPTESAVNAKHGTKYAHAPVTENTSCQQRDQMNSTPEQSSSMINIESCQPEENTCQNHSGSSPCGHWHSSAGRMQCQEQSSSMMNGQKGQPQENTCQNQTESSQLHPSPPSDYNPIPKRKSRGRGPTRCLKLSGEGKRIRITINELGQPVGHETIKLVTFLGTLARNGKFLPLNYLDWRALPCENKENMWEKVQLMFEIDPMCKDWVLQSLGKKWKDWKSKLKLAHYYPHETDEERLADRDERVPPDQWAKLISLWNTETVQKCSSRNRTTRLQQRYRHTTGQKSFARIREEQKANTPGGKAPSRAELFILTRTRKDGQPIDEAASSVIKQIQDLTKGQDTQHDSNDKVDILSQVLGHGKNGNIRCLELGPSPSELGCQKPTRAEAMKMVSEANVEMREMKEKMAVMEKTCSQMASQMAEMMSMMSSINRNLPDKNVPDIVVNTCDASGCSSPPQVHTSLSPSAGLSRQTRRTRRKF